MRAIVRATVSSNSDAGLRTLRWSTPQLPRDATQHEGRRDTPDQRMSCTSRQSWRLQESSFQGPKGNKPNANKAKLLEPGWVTAVSERFPDLNLTASRAARCVVCRTRLSRRCNFFFRFL